MVNSPSRNLSIAVVVLGLAGYCVSFGPAADGGEQRLARQVRRTGRPGGRNRPAAQAGCRPMAHRRPGRGGFSRCLVERPDLLGVGADHDRGAQRIADSGGGRGAVAGTGDADGRCRRWVRGLPRLLQPGGPAVLPAGRGGTTGCVAAQRLRPGLCPGLHPVPGPVSGPVSRPPPSTPVRRLRRSAIATTGLRPDRCHGTRSARRVGGPTRSGWGRPRH